MKILASKSVFFRLVGILTLTLIGLTAMTARAASINVITAGDNLTPNDGTVSWREATTAIKAGNRLGDPDISPGWSVSQLDPDDRNYVLETFTISTDTLQVLVTKTASGPYLAGKEYWHTNQSMLGAIAGATSGTAMTISGASHNWPAPSGFSSDFRMQDPVTWGTASAPSGLSWVYSVTGTNTYVCIKFNLSGSSGNYSVSSITWYLAAKSAPRSGTYVFPPGTTYSLSYANAPTLPTGYSWYGVTVNPGS